MNTIETIKLDRVPKGKMPVLHASQYDNGRTYGIDLTNLGEAWKLDGTETLTINERKVDNNICSMDIENTFTGSSHIEFASFLQMCACAGSNFCELRISKGDVDIGTLNFILEVEPDPTADGIESESEIRNLETQIEAITEEVIGEDHYTKTQTDDAIATAIEGKADTTYVDTELAKKADKTDTYTKTQVDNALNNKMDKANPTGTGSFSLNRKANTSVGEKSVAMGNNATASGENSMAIGNNSFASGANSVAMGNGTRALGANQFVFGKLNSDNNYNNYVEIVGKGNSFTRSNARTLDWQGNETLAGDLTYNGNKSLTSEISRLDGRIDNLPAPMIFKGTLGVGGTIQTLPTASASNEGFTYKVITDGTYAGQTAKVGDVFTSNGSEWVYIPSGDEDNDTWRAIKVNGVEKLGNGISSGSLDVVDTDNIEAEFDNDGNKLKLKTKNIYTKNEVDDIVYGILPDDTASGSVANFTTSLELPIKSLEVDVNAVQESGTPTPSTPKAISGWNAITLDVNGTTVVINLGDTYYGGHLTQDKAGHRQFEVTHGYYNLDALSWTHNANGFWQANKPDDIARCNASEVPQVIAEKYQMQTGTWVYGHGSTYGYFGMNGGLIYITDENTPSGYIVSPLGTPYIIDLPDGEPIITLNGINNIYADTGDTSVVFKSSVNDYVSAHSGGNLLGMGGVYLGGAKSGGGEEETDEGEDTEKVKLDEPKEEIKTIGDMKKLGGE